MHAASRISQRFLRDSELDYLRYGLRLDASAGMQKRALQTLCGYYEAGRRIANASDVRQMIHSHLGSPDVLVRRWAMKALALIGHPDDFSRIADRLKVERDAEAQTWGVTGLAKNAQDLSLNEVCKAAGLTKSSAIALAARLYAPERWLRANSEPLSISLHDDELTLKWATFLIGYGKAPEDLFHPRYSNAVFLGELNVHDAAEISEYSIWALWEREEFGPEFSRIPLGNARRHPESVRKWLYRLATQSPAQVGLDSSALADLRRDPADRAREGLALGVAELDPAVFATEVLEWYTVETSPEVRANLLASMAARSAEDVDYADVVERCFAGEQPDSLLRRRLLAASEGTPLYGNLRRIAIDAERDRQGLLMYDRPSILVQGDYKVNSPTLNVGGNLNAQTVAVGDMFNSANAAVQQLSRADQGAADALREVLKMLASASVPGHQEVVEAVEKVAKAPSAESKKGLVDKLKDYGAKASALGSAISGFDKLIDAVQSISV